MAKLAENMQNNSQIYSDKDTFKAFIENNYVLKDDAS